MRGGCVPLNRVLLRLGDGGAVELDHVDAFGTHGDDLVLADLDGTLRVVDERGDIGAEEVLPFAEADNERAVTASRDDHVRIVFVDCEQRKGPFEVRDARTHGLREALGGLTFAREEVGDDLRVGVREELVAVVGKLLFEGGEVFDDAVVDKRDFAIFTTEVGVGVRVAWTAVSRPAGVPDGRARFRGLVALELVAKVLNFSGRLEELNSRFAAAGDPCRVIAAVFEATQPPKNDLTRSR